MVGLGLGVVALGGGPVQEIADLFVGLHLLFCHVAFCEDVFDRCNSHFEGFLGWLLLLRQGVLLLKDTIIYLISR